MGVPLSDDAQAFLHEKVYAHIATLMRDGSPQSTIVWVDTDGVNILVNNPTNRVKLKNMQRDGRVALSIADPQDPYRTMYIRGRVIDISGAEEGLEFIDTLAMKYRGQERYPGTGSLVRSG
jgi:PPOX class probable F420-dependent enzyme